MSQCTQRNQPRDRGQDEITSTSSRATKHPLVISAGLCDRASQLPSSITPSHRSLALPPLIDHFSPQLKPTPKATFTPTLAEDTTLGISSAQNIPLRRSRIVLDIDLNPLIPIFDDSESQSNDQIVHPSSKSVIGAGYGTPPVQPPTCPQLFQVLNDNLPTSSISSDNIPGVLPVSKVTSRPRNVIDQEHLGTPSSTTSFTASPHNAEPPRLSSSSSGHRVGSNNRVTTMESKMDLEPNVHERTSDELLLSAASHGRSSRSNNDATRRVTSREHRSTTPYLRQRSTRLLSTSLFTPLLDDAELPRSFSPPPFPSTGNADETSIMHDMMDVDTHPTDVLAAELPPPTTSGHPAQSSDNADRLAVSVADCVYDPAMAATAERAATGSTSLILFTPLLDDATLPASFSPPPLPSTGNVDEISIMPDMMDVDTHPTDVPPAELPPPTTSGHSAQGSDNAVSQLAVSVASCVHDPAMTSTTERAAIGSTSLTLFTPSLDDADIPACFSPPPIPSNGNADETSVKHDRMDVETHSTDVVTTKPVTVPTSDDCAKGSDNVEPHLAIRSAGCPSRSATTGRQRSIKLFPSALFTPSLDNPELPNSFSSSPSHRTGSEDITSTTVAQMKVDSARSEQTSHERARQAASDCEADSPSRLPCTQSSPNAGSLDLSVKPFAESKQNENHTGRHTRPPLVTIDIHDCHPVSLFDDSTPGQEREHFTPRRGLLSPFNADDNTVFVRRDSSKLEAEFNRGPISGEGASGAMEAASKLHWKIRWAKFPLKEVIHGQSKAAFERLLLQCINNMDTDEVNLHWLTKELLSQKFSVPVRYFWSIIYYLCNFCQAVDSPPLSHTHMLSEAVQDSLTLSR